MEKFYLGISLGFNSSACIVSTNNGVISAVSQERMNGKKNTKDIPFDAILECIKLAKINKIDKIVISHYEGITINYFKSHCDLTYINGCNTWQEIILKFLKLHDICICDNKIIRVDHQTSHAYSTFGFYSSKQFNDKYYLVTSDGFGDGLSATITDSFFNNRISEVLLENSIALVYQFTTGALGFKEHQHEGKITGLAAYGKSIYLNDFESLFDQCDYGNGLSFKIVRELNEEEQDKVKNSTITYFDKFLLLRESVYSLVNNLKSNGATREDISASVQEFAEKYTLSWLKRYCKDKRDVYLAGGLFANVKINQRIKDSGLFNNVYVCPPMGDEGTCIGSVIYEMIKNNDYNVNNENSTNMAMLGSDINCFDKIINNVSNIIDEKGLKLKYNISIVDNDIVIDNIIKALENNKIICLMHGRMEFGPRALCHRTILYDATKKETNDSLNARLSRSEFMPFAPVCRQEVAKDLFKNLNGGEESAKFMTMTFDGTEEFVNTYKAVSHVDGTARPQIINKKDDNFIWSVLKQYENDTGKKCLVNTSFNLHEQPIIREEIAAINSFIKADLDVLMFVNDKFGALVIEKCI
jgi:carbamoyltransferase